MVTAGGGNVTAGLLGAGDERTALRMVAVKSEQSFNNFLCKWKQ